MNERELIYERLNELRPELATKACTPRVMSELGVDALLDELIELQQTEVVSD